MSDDSDDAVGIVAIGAGVSIVWVMKNGVIKVLVVEDSVVTSRIIKTGATALKTRKQLEALQVASSKAKLVEGSKAASTTLPSSLLQTEQQNDEVNSLLRIAEKKSQNAVKNLAVTSIDSQCPQTLLNDDQYNDPLLRDSICSAVNVIPKHENPLAYLVSSLGLVLLALLVGLAIRFVNPSRKLSGSRRR